MCPLTVRAERPDESNQLETTVGKWEDMKHLLVESQMGEEFFEHLFRELL